MIKISCFKGKAVALFGLGRSGLATASALREGGAAVTVWDDAPQAVEQARAAGFGAQNLRETDWSGISALILSPGVPLTHPKPHWSVALARAAGAEIIGDMELFARERAAFLQERNNAALCPVIAITGTNGKSTATALLAHLLRAAGKNVQMGGNIGKPVLELDAFADSSKQVYVLEVSSYQSDLAPSLRPTVGIVLNITPDHIDRHGSFANYAAVKERLAARSDMAIIGTDGAAGRAVYDRLAKAGKKLARIGKTDLADCAAEPYGYVYKNGAFYRGGRRLGAAAALRGRHNGQNGLAALAACAALGARGFAGGIAGFKGLPHRMEDVGFRDYKGVKIHFINDSKATNAEAAAPALQSFENIYWLAGGRAKAGGIDSLLAPQYLRHIQAAYFFGEAGAAFAESFARHKAACCHRAAMAEAFAAAVCQAKQDIDEKMRQGRRAAGKNGNTDVFVLLSPACASFDAFKNFEERGKAFRAMAEALPA